MKAFKWMFCLTATYVLITAAFAEALTRYDFAENPYVVRSAQKNDDNDDEIGSCTATMVGPHTLLSSGHCFTKLKAGDLMDVYGYKNGSDGNLLGNYGVTKIARNGVGSTGLLLIELDKELPRYTSVCQDTFQDWDVLQQYGTAQYGKDEFFPLRTKQRRIGRTNSRLYTFWPMYGQDGDSGGPYMYHNNVAAVHYGWRWNKIRIGDMSSKDIATNLQDGWVFNQDIYVSMQHCRPERSLGFAQGATRGGVDRITASGDKIKVESYDDNMFDYRDAGTITLHGGATASGALTSQNTGFRRVEATRDGKGITFYEYDDHMLELKVAGTIRLHGVRVSGSLRCGGNIVAIKGKMRKIAFQDDTEYGECGSLSLRP